MKKLQLFILLVLGGNVLLGQRIERQVWACAGQTVNLQGYNFSFTVGENAVSLLQSSNNPYLQRQGFQQKPLIVTSVHSHDDFTGFHIYPNPAGNFLIIEFNDKQAIKPLIAIYDVNGKTQSFKLSNYKSDSNALQLDLSSLSRGMYFLVITNTKSLQRQAFRIIKSFE